MAKSVFSGDIVLFYAYDIGEDIDLEYIKAQHLLPTFNSPLSARFKNYHSPISFHMRGVDIVAEGEPHEMHTIERDMMVGEDTTPEDAEGDMTSFAMSKIHTFGVISFCYRIPFKGTMDNLKRRLVDVKQEYDMRADDFAYDTFKRIHSAIRTPHFFNMKNDYFTVHINTVRSAVPSEQLFEAFGAEIASMLRLEVDPLSPYQQDMILRSRTGYYGDELVVVDSSGSFVYDDSCYEAIELFEFVTIQLLELKCFDHLLDRRLHTFYLTSLDTSRTRSSAAIVELAELRVEISVITERLENTIRLSGDEYYTEIYERLVKKLAIPQWRDGVQKKLDIIRDLYEVQQTGQDLVFHKRWTLVIVGLIALESIVGIVHFLHYWMHQ
jgi:hypothetical protein